MVAPSVICAASRICLDFQWFSGDDPEWWVYAVFPVDRRFAA
jgi:hypothetical protein